MCVWFYQIPRDTQVTNGTGSLEFSWRCPFQHVREKWYDRQCNRGGKEGVPWGEDELSIENKCAWSPLVAFPNSRVATSSCFGQRVNYLPWPPMIYFWSNVNRNVESRTWEGTKKRPEHARVMHECRGQTYFALDPFSAQSPLAQWPWATLSAFLSHIYFLI